jgi:hypothetical protein
MNEIPKRTWRARSAFGKRMVLVWVAAGALVVGTAAYVAVAALAPKATALYIGDSLTWESATAISQDLQAKGFTPQIHAVPGSGLLDTQVNWLTRAQQYVAEYKPKVVVAEFVGDYGLFGKPPGLVEDTPAFFADWAVQAQDLENILASQGAQVYWVVGPPLENPASEAELIKLDAIYAHLHAPAGSTDKPLIINTVKEFGTASGGYTPSVPVSGQPVTVRLPDGTHFTPAGVTLFAKTVVGAIAT